MTKMKDILSDKCPKSVLYNCSRQPKMLMVGLNALRNSGELLDVTFVVEKRSFRAHRVVLAACSDYFKAMFTGSMMEADQSEIVLNGITAEGFQVLLDYAYTSMIPLNLANVQNVLAAASHLQMIEVVHICSNYLQSQIDIDNCIDLVTIADTYSLSQLKIKVYKFMSGHLTELSHNGEFYRLTPQHLENLLTYEFLVNCSEEDVLKIVLRWLLRLDSSDVGVCQSYASSLLRHIHFAEISPDKLEGLVERTYSSRRGYLWMQRLVLSESWKQRRQVDVAGRPGSADLLNSRGMEQVLLKIGGFGVGGVTNEITYRFSGSQKWRRLTTVPHVEQCNFGAAVYNNELYVVGGCFNQLLEENVHPFGFKYIPARNQWQTIKPMRTERCRFSLNVVGDKLYAVGGASDADGVDTGDLPNTDTCEVYDPSTDAWRNVAPLPETRSQHAGAALGDRLFVSGGICRESSAIASTFVYNAELDVWRDCKPMLTPRADHVMLNVAGQLYVCGGWRDDNVARRRTHNCTVDRYDPAADHWETVTRIPTPRFHAGFASVGNKIYIVGGFHSESMFDRERAAIECYDTLTDTWTTLEKYPQDIWEHACATLYIPKCRDDVEVSGDRD